jgi:dienelactone hydrolase
MTAPARGRTAGAGWGRSTANATERARGRPPVAAVGSALGTDLEARMTAASGSGSSPGGGSPPSSLRGRRGVRLVVGLAMVLLAWVQVLTGTAGVEVETSTYEGLPVTLLVPAGASDAPGVVVAHGFAGSAVLMRSFGLALASAGQVVALPDLPGHGANPVGLDRSGDGADLVLAVATAAELLRGRPEVGADAIVLLGHSMGSGAVLQAGIDDQRRIAGVVAISPTDAPVASGSPPNLLLLAGQREPRFVANAQDLLARAGGASADVEAALADGSARALEVVPGVEHVSILFSPTAHRASAAWVQRATGRPGPVPASSPAIAWWLVHLVGVLLVWRTVAPVLAPAGVTEAVPDAGRGGAGRAELARWRQRPAIGAAAGGVLATAAVALLGAVTPLGTLGGMLVAPALAAWFALAGGLWLAIGPRPARPRWSDVPWALGLLAVLVLAFGVVAARVWLPFVPPMSRALVAVPLALATLPWTLATATALQGRRGWRLAGRWLAVVATSLVTLGVATVVVPALGFLVLLLPLFPGLLALLALVTTPVPRPWAGALAGAAFLGWTMAVLFPTV